jgi:hypothetical protein
VERVVLNALAQQNAASPLISCAFGDYSGIVLRTSRSTFHPPGPESFYRRQRRI